MSVRLQNRTQSLPQFFAKVARVAEREAKISRSWAMIVWLPLGVTAAFAVSNLIIIVILTVLGWIGISATDYFRPALFQAIISCVIYICTIATILFVPYLLDKRKVDIRVIGLQRLPTWTDIGLAPVTFIAYALAITFVLSIVTAVFPGFPIDQAQDVGFKAFGSRADNILAFLTLVVVAPVAEETLFRGYLYGKLKGYVPAIWAALVTSVLFALAHLQLNVGIDVFVLSLFLCGLRSLTGSIWSGILVHMIKNGIAYYILFIQPVLGG